MIRSPLAAGSVLALVTLAACHKKATPPTPPVPVTVTTVQRTDVPRLIKATGTVEPIATAAVQAQVSGLLIHVDFKEGDVVSQGQVLFEIDPRPFQAALDQARGTLNKDSAQWASAEQDVDRYTALAAKDYVTQQQLDQTRAQANSLAGTMRSDSAAIETARLNLQYATIHAPISGRAGSILVKEGNQVRGGADQTLVVINQISPILVRFPIPASLFDGVRRRADSSLVVRAWPVGDSTHAETGQLDFLDNTVDSLTGTVLLKARFVNADGTLWPGGLDAVALQLDVERNALVVPTGAVQTSQTGNVIWMVDSAHRAHPITVTVERSTDSLSVITHGLTAGETIVTDGQLRLTDSARVAIRTSATGAVPPGDSNATEVLDTTQPNRTRATTGGARGKPHP